MLRFILPAAIAVSLLPHAGPAGTLKDECKAVSALAVIGYHDWDVVTVHPDTDKNECRFGVNGATAGSPPQDQVTGAYNALFGPPGQPDFFLGAREIDTRALALLLLAAGPDETPDAVESILADAGEALEECRRAAGRNEPIALKEIPDGSAACGTFPAGQAEVLLDLGPLRTTAGGRLERTRMTVAVRRGNSWNFVSFPVR